MMEFQALHVPALEEDPCFYLVVYIGSPSQWLMIF